MHTQSIKPSQGICHPYPMIEEVNHLGGVLEIIHAHGQQLERALHCPSCALPTATLIQENLRHGLKKEGLLLVQKVSNLRPASYQLVSKEAYVRMESEGGAEPWLLPYAYFTKPLPANPQFLFLDENTLKVLFGALSSHPLTPGGMFGEGCLCRAEILGLLLLGMGCDPKQIFTVKLYAPEGQFMTLHSDDGQIHNWGFHAALAVQTAEGMLILDLALFPKGWAEPRDWIASFYPRDGVYTERRSPGTYPSDHPLLVYAPLGKRCEVKNSKIFLYDNDANYAKKMMQIVLRQATQRVLEKYPFLNGLFARRISAWKWSLSQELRCSAELHTAAFLGKLDYLCRTENQFLVLTEYEVRKFTPEIALVNKRRISELLIKLGYYREKVAQTPLQTRMSVQLLAAVDTLCKQLSILYSSLDRAVETACLKIKHYQWQKMKRKITADPFLKYGENALLNRIDWQIFKSMPGE